MKRNGFALIGIVIAVVILAAVAGGMVFRQKRNPESPVAATNPDKSPRLVPSSAPKTSPTPFRQVKCPPDQEAVYADGAFSKCVVATSQASSQTPEPTATPNIPVQSLIIPDAWLSCRQNPDCVLAENPCGGCPIGVNQKYQSALEEKGCLKVDPIVDPDSGSRCSWSLMGCSGSPAAVCFNRSCRAQPCL